MQSRILALYKYFDLRIDCSDDQFRHKYTELARRVHPDLHPGDAEGATRKTQELTAAYAELKEHRKRHPVASLNADKDEGIKKAEPSTIRVNISNMVEVSINHDPYRVSLELIAELKQEFRDAWQQCRQKPWDVKAALRLVMAAFNAGRPDTVEDLIQNEQLVDAAAILADIYSNDEAGRLALRWAERLALNREPELAIQMLNDILGIFKKESVVEQELRDQLRKLHYGMSQGIYSGQSKPEPSVRASHLLAIVELGFELGYVHKFLAEAFHDLEQDDLARQHLEYAFKIDPQLSGAKTISRALGLIDSQLAKRSARSRVQYRYSHAEDVPTASDAFEWFKARKWDEILEHSILGDYSPRILPLARAALTSIGAILGEQGSTSSVAALKQIATCQWWDSRQAAFSSQAKVGDLSDLELLRKIAAEKDGYDRHVLDPLGYFEARIERLEWKGSLSDLLSEAASLERSPIYLKCGKLGRLRWELEQFTERHGNTLELILCVTRSCLDMGDWPRVVTLLQPMAERNTIEGKHENGTELQSHLAAALVMAGEQESAIALLRSTYDAMSQEQRNSANKILQDALQVAWIPSANLQCLWALETLFDEALKRTSPAQLLSDLHTLSRVMEPLGEREMGLWLKQTLRAEAPGHWFGDPHDRLNYFASPMTSATSQMELKRLCKEYQPRIIQRLKTVLRSDPVVSPSDPKLIR